MTILVDVLAVIGALTVTSFLLLTAVVWHVHRLRRKRDAERNAELFAALVEAMDRHPAGNRRDLTALGRPIIAVPCGHVLFCPSKDNVDAELLAMTHVLTCSVAEKIEGKTHGDA